MKTSLKKRGKKMRSRWFKMKEVDTKISYNMKSDNEKQIIKQPVFNSLI